MDARQLRFFLAVVENGGISRAATALYVAQPSVSQTMKRLEDELGSEIFERSGRGIRLTAAGRALVEPARQVTADLRAAADTISEITRLQRGRLDLVVTSDLAIDPLADVVALFRSSYPGVWVNVLEASSPAAVLDTIRRGSCEFGLCALPVEGPGVGTVPLGARELVLAFPPRTEDLPSDPIPVQEMDQIPLIVGPTGDVVRDLIEQRFREFGVTPRIRVEVEVAAVHGNFVLAGLGAAFLPSGVAAEIAAHGAVIRSASPALTQRFGFACRDDSLSSATTRFIDLARQHLDGIGTGTWSSARGQTPAGTSR